MRIRLLQKSELPDSVDHLQNLKNLKYKLLELLLITGFLQIYVCDRLKNIDLNRSEIDMILIYYSINNMRIRVLQKPELLDSVVHLQNLKNLKYKLLELLLTNSFFQIYVCDRLKNIDFNRSERIRYINNKFHHKAKANIVYSQDTLFT